MWPYLSLFAMPTIFGLTNRRGFFNDFLWVAGFFAIILFVGLRHKVGMDWNNYLLMIERVSLLSLDEALRFVEPSYGFLLWLGVKSGFSIYFTNVVTSAIFVTGLYAFLSKTEEPWLGLIAALPILIIVVAMSANRQAPAIGILMLVTAFWYQLKLPVKVALILFASTFHFSAFFFLVFIALNLRIHFFIKMFASLFAGALMLYVFTATNIGNYYNSLYIVNENEITQSQGALVHVALNAFFGALIFLKKNVREILFPTPLLKQLGVLAIFLFFLAIFIPNASARMSLYLFPVSIYVISRMPMLFNMGTRPFIRMFVALLFGLQSWGWLTYANSAAGHIPYGNYLFVDEELKFNLGK